MARDTALFRCDQPDDGSVIYRPQPLPSAQGGLEPGTVPGHRLNRGTPSGSHSAALVASRSLSLRPRCRCPPCGSIPHHLLSDGMPESQQPSAIALAELTLHAALRGDRTEHRFAVDRLRILHGDVQFGVRANRVPPLRLPKDCQHRCCCHFDRVPHTSFAGEANYARLKSHGR
jgi:hypothetical protein